MKKVFIFVAGFFLLATAAHAATFEVGERVEHNGDAIADDLYMAGGVVDISSNIFGDSVAAGGEISISGDVTGDILSAGGSIDLLGTASDDVRVVGGEILISGTIRDDLVAAGGYVRMLGDANIGGDVVIASGASFVNGTISGDVTVYGGETVVGGVINGDVDLTYVENVTLGEDLTVGGNLTYGAKTELEIPENALIGGEVIQAEAALPSFDQDKKETFQTSFAFGKLIMTLVVALILVLLFKKLSLRFGEDGYKHFWKNALVGLIAMIVTPILALILAVSLIGMYAGGLLFLIGTTLLVLAKAYSGILAGALLSKWTVKKVTVDWKWAILGVVALFIVKLIPVIGGLTCFLMTLVAFGTILMIIHRGVWQKR